MNGIVNIWQWWNYKSQINIWHLCQVNKCASMNRTWYKSKISFPRLLSVKRKIDPSKWISVAGKMKGTTQLARTFNTFLISLENRLYDAYLLLLGEKVEITATLPKNKYTGDSDKKRMLMTIFQQHNDEIASLVPKQFSKGTLERYKTSMSHTNEFMKFKYHVSDMDVRSINHEFIKIL